MAGPGISYVLTLESKQFLQELSRAKQEAKGAAKEINDGFGKAGNEAGGLGGKAQQAAKEIGNLKSVGQDANASMQVFSSSANALSSALSGNFVGAASSAARAFKGLTAAMNANPIMLALTVIATLTTVVYKAARAWRDYRDGVEAAKASHAEFMAGLDAIAMGASSPGDIEVKARLAGFGDLVTKDKDIAQAESERAQQAQEVARRRKWAEQSSLAGDEAEAKAAKDNYAAAVAILKGMDEILAEAKKAQQDQKSANAAEAQRLRENAAEGNSAAMQKLADQMAEAYEKKFGKGSLDTYEKRLSGRRGGTVTEEEIAAYKEVETYRKRVAEQVKREAEEEARAKEKAAQDAEQAARKAAIEAQKTAAAEQKLARTREEVLAATKNADELQKLANQKRGEADMAFGEWYAGKEMGQEEMDARLEAQRLNDRAKSIRDAQQREREQTEREAENKRKQAQQEARESREDWRKRAVAMGDADALEAEAKRQVEEANKKFGTKNSWKDMSKEEWARREWADTLYQDAKKIRGEEPEEKPWAVGVTAVRGMSVADVFTAMRGMGGAQVARDPNLDANQKTAKNTATMAQRMDDIARALTAEGVN
jgi:hypothetical protein